MDAENRRVDNDSSLVDSDSLSLLGFEPSKEDAEHQTVCNLSVTMVTETKSWKLESWTLSNKNRKLKISKNLIL